MGKMWEGKRVMVLHHSPFIREVGGAPCQDLSLYFFHAVCAEKKKEKSSPQVSIVNKLSQSH